MKNAYDLAHRVQELAFAEFDAEVKLLALELADAVRREKDAGYTPMGWAKTGLYGSCADCGDFLRGCGIGFGPGGLTVCPDCYAPVPSLT